MTRLSQVIGNLLSNAAKYTEDGGEIRLAIETVRGTRGASEVLFRVSDSGVGIPPEMLPKLFQLFMQVDRTVDRAQGGLGIGLALARRLVEMHGGTVTAYSEGPGRGSEFVVRLPVWTPPKESAASGPASSSTTNRGPSRRVLVVDDNVDSARSLAKMLQLEGYEMTTAHDGLEALEVAERIRPDVILLDLGMPKLDGYGTARMLREKPWGKGLALIAVTGWGQEEVRGRTRDAGFDAHLVKPVEMPTLLELVRSLSARAEKSAAEPAISAESARGENGVARTALDARGAAVDVVTPVHGE
jgi:CheY-like chemotaxis protein